jgi:hypothetical protein
MDWLDVIEEGFSFTEIFSEECLLRTKRRAATRAGLRR